MKTFTRTITLKCAAMLLFAFGTASAYAQRGERTKARVQPMEAMAAANLAKVRSGITAEAPKAAGDEDQARWETLLSEDFSLLTKGSEDNPDGVMYPTSYFTDYSYVLPDSLFHTPGWTGVGVYEAGGCVALAYPGMGGLINTGTCNMNGRVRIRLRAKAINGNATFFMSVLYGGYMNPVDPIGGQMNMYNLKPEDGWQDITLTLDNPYTGDDCMVQVNAMAYNSGALIIDQIDVERDREHVATPGSLAATRFTYDGFTAAWGKAYGAKTYLASLYEERTVGTQNVKSNISFEDNGIEGGTITRLPEGWTASLESGESAKIAAEGGYGSDRYLVVGGADTLTYDVGNRLLKNVTFALKKVDGTDKNHGVIKIGFLIGGEWRTYSIKLSDTEWQAYDLANSQTFRGFHMENAKKFRIYGNNLEMGTNTYGLDELCCETTPERETSCIQQDVETDTTAVSFSGLDLEANDYYFTVKAKSEDGRLSAESDPVYAYGVAAPHVKEATEVDPRGAFTANWEAAPNATGYLLRIYQIYTSPEDQAAYKVFEENFSKCTAGEENKPVFLGNYENMLLDDYCDNPGWNGTGTLVAPGMVGCYEDDTNTMYYDLQSPEISVGHGDRTYTVDVTFKLQNSDETLCVQGDNTDYASIPCSAPGTYQRKVTLKEGTNNTHLLFYTLNNTPFLLQNVTVTQDVKQGDQFYTQLGINKVSGEETEARISGIGVEDGYSYAYCLTSLYDRYGTTYTSGRSDYQTVDFSGTDGIDRAAQGETCGTPLCYDLAGRRVEKPAHGIYVVKTGGSTRKIMVK